MYGPPTAGIRNAMETTDDQNEIFDVVDENDKVIGQASRREVHSNKNLIHRSIGIAVINSNNKIFLLFLSLSIEFFSHTKNPIFTFLPYRTCIE